MKKLLILTFCLIVTQLLFAITFNVTVPSGTNSCWVTGNFCTWKNNIHKMNRVDATHYTLTVAEADFTDQTVTQANIKYKYLSGGGDWAYVEKDATGAEISDRDWTAADVVAKWAVVSTQTNVAFIYNTDLIDANSFKTLLEANNCTVTLISISKTITTNFSGYDVIITSPVSVFTKAQMDTLNAQNKPIISMGSGGYKGFGLLALAIGSPYGMSGSENTMYVEDAYLPVYNTPNKITINSGDSLRLFSVAAASSSSRMIYVPTPVASIEGLLRYRPLYYPVIRQSRKYTFWGFSLSPEGMTQAGKDLFVNVVFDAVNVFYKSINISKTSIVNLNYDKGAGPSAEQSFTVSGTVLASDVVITPTPNIQISKTSGSGFSNTPITLAQSSGSLASTTIYVRLKAGLNFGNYNDSILITATDAVTRKIICSGVVTGPTLSISKTSIANLNYDKGAGPSAEQSFTVSGTVLASDVVVTPTSNIQISKTSGSGFSNTPITLAQSSGSLATTTIYVRLKAGLNYANYNDSIQITATDAATKKVTCSGTVFGPYTSLSKASVTGFTYTRGFGPSSSQNFQISGSLLEGDLTITPPVNFELSTNNSTFSSAPMVRVPSNSYVGLMTIYIRLKAGLSIGNYSGNLIVSSPNTTDKVMSCSGTVLGPNIITSTTSLSGLNYTFDNGPSDQQSFTVSGADLTSAITITPNTNFQISTVSGGSFSTAPIILPLSGTVVNPTTIYVRLKAGLAGANYNGDLTLTATNADTRTVACSGTVDNGTGLSYSATVPANTRACYIAGTMTNGNLQAMTKSDATHYTITIPGATLTDTYLFYSGPDASYIEKDANGGAVSARSYSSNDVVANWAAVYDPTPYYNIAAQVGANGALKDGNVIVNNGASVSVASGATKTFTITPSAGYEVATLTYNGADVKSQITNNQFTTPAVDANATLSVTFSKVQYHLAIKLAESGTSDLMCEYGATPAFQFNPANGWQISTVMYNGVDVTSSLINGGYSVPAITDNSLLSVTFELSTVLNTSSSSRIKVYSTQSQIMVEGTLAGESISLITAGGVQLQTIKSKGERIVINAPQNANYVVKTATKTVKVAL